MHKTILVGLTGHSARFQLDELAYERLTAYLDRAAARLREDPDGAEIVGDLERSIGDKLAARLTATDQLVEVAAIDAVLAAIGAVETGHGPATTSLPVEPRPRRLRRVREGQEIAGVCTGLAAYTEIDVDWVRTVFILGSLVTAGLLGVVYIAMAVILPITSVKET